MIHGRMNVLAWFDAQTNKPYFSIFRNKGGDNSNPVFTNRDHENETTASARARLDSFLNLLATGEFFIVANENEKTTAKGRAETAFSLSQSEQSHTTPSISGIGVGYLTPEQADQRAQDQFTRLMTEHELKSVKERVKELEKENKELNNKISGPWNKVVDTVAPHIGTILGSLGLTGATATPLPVSGHPESHTLDNNENVGEVTAEQNERINKALLPFCEALAKRYPNEWISIIERLTVAINEKPAMIDMALKML